MKRPCKWCPCKPTTPEYHRELVREAMPVILASGGFPCHAKHRDAHVLTEAAIGDDGKFHTTDCAGYAIWGLTNENGNNKRLRPAVYECRTRAQGSAPMYAEQSLR